MRLDITPYADVDLANEYFTTRLDTRDWDMATETEKLKALKMATRFINNLKFKGYKAISTQENEFPRSESEYGNISAIIPNEIKIATCEIAIQLINEIDIEQEINNLYITSNSFASVSTGKGLGIVPEHIRAGIPSIVAWHYLRPYLIDPYSCQVEGL